MYIKECMVNVHMCKCEKLVASTKLLGTRTLTSSIFQVLLCSLKTSVHMSILLSVLNFSPCKAFEMNNILFDLNKS